MNSSITMLTPPPYTAEQQAANREKWIEALESGEYKQAQNTLRKDDKFCCLGVACDINGIGHWENGSYFVGKLEYHATLPYQVKDWLGLRTPAGHGKEFSLSYYNDNGSTFQEIAEMLRKNDLLFY